MMVIYQNPGSQPRTYAVRLLGRWFETFLYGMHLGESVWLVPGTFDPNID